MTQHLLPSKTVLLACLFLLLINNSSFLLLFAQSSSTGRVMVCESTGDACRHSDALLDIVWTFDGTEGTVSSPGGQAGVHLTIEKFDSDSIVIRRVDRSGPTAGLTALYTGSVRGNYINGMVQWSWPAHAGYPAKGSFAAKLQDQGPASDNSTLTSTSRDSLPSELLVCENGGSCNAAWSFNGSTGTGT